jgi:triosephosphate isomerase
LATQIRAGLAGLATKDVSRLVIAYEPVWAIGTGRNATPQQAQDAHLFVRRELAVCFGEKTASELPILYGGSVKPENAGELMRQSEVDGALVGGASLVAAQFLAIAGAAS